MRLLVVEDDVKLRALLARGLAECGHAVDTAATGAEALWRSQEASYDAVVLDVGLPDLDGFHVCGVMRERGCWAPILFLTARDDIADRVHGLDAGADDYLVKPFALPELLARLRALRRRAPGPRPTRILVGDLEIDPAARTVKRAGTPITLTGREFALLEHLARHAEEVVSRSRLLEHVWDFAFDGDPHVVNVYVAYLREKIDKPFGRVSLQTVRGAGFRLCDDRTS